MKRKPSPHYNNLHAQVEKLIDQVKSLTTELKSVKADVRTLRSEVKGRKESAEVDNQAFIAAATEIDQDLIPAIDLVKKYGFRDWRTVVNILRNVEMAVDVTTDEGLRTFTHKVNGDFWLKEVVNNAEYRDNDGRLECKEASESGKKMGTFAIPRNWVRSEIKSYRG